jgi:hypothetical protein
LALVLQGLIFIYGIYLKKITHKFTSWIKQDQRKKFGILSEAKKMPMKQDADDADGDGNTTEKVPAFLDKGDAKKKKTSGKVPPQLQKHVKAKQDKSKKDLEEKKMTKAEKKEEEKLGKEMGKAKVKSKMQKQYGKEKGEEIYYKTKRKKAMENA